MTTADKIAALLVELEALARTCTREEALEIRGVCALAQWAYDTARRRHPDVHDEGEE